MRDTGAVDCTCAPRVHCLGDLERSEFLGLDDLLNDQPTVFTTTDFYLIGASVGHCLLERPDLLEAQTHCLATAVVLWVHCLTSFVLTERFCGSQAFVPIAWHTGPPSRR